MIITVSIGFPVKMSPGLGGCVVSLGKKHNCQSVSFHPEIQMVSTKVIQKVSVVGFSCDGPQWATEVFETLLENVTF